MEKEKEKNYVEFILGIITGVASTLGIQRVIEWYRKVEIEKYQKLGDTIGKSISETIARYIKRE